MSGEKKGEGKKQAFGEYQEKATIIQDVCNAARAGNLEEIKQLLVKDPSALNGTPPDQVPLLWAIQAPTNEAFLYLQSIGADTSLPPPPGKSWPQRIIFDGRWPINQVLEVLSKEPFTGLEDHFLAAFRGDDLFTLRPWAKDNLGNNIAHYASAGSRLRLLEDLKLRYKSMLLAPNFEGITPFLAAIQCRQFQATTWFLDYDLVNLREEEVGNTCMQLAARAGFGRFMDELIIDYGIDPGDGMEIARLLKEAAGKLTDDNNKELLELAEELRSSYIEYYLIQQASVNRYIETGETLEYEEVIQLIKGREFKKENKEQKYLKAGLPFEIIEPLKEIMADYIPPYTEEQLDTPNKIIQENAQILSPLKAYIDKHSPHDTHVIKVLYLHIRRLRNLNAATIREAVENFKLTSIYKNTLGINKEVINAVLINTEPFAPKKRAPTTKQSAFSGIFSFLKGGDSKASAPKEDRQIKEREEDTSKDAMKKQNTSVALIAELTPLTKGLQWTANGHGGARAKFDNIDNARHTRKLLHDKGYLNLVIERGEFETDGECYLDVYALEKNLTQLSESTQSITTSTSSSSTHFQSPKGVEPPSPPPKKEAKSENKKESEDRSIELTDFTPGRENSGPSKSS